MVEASSRPVAKTRVSTRVFSENEIREISQKYGTPVFLIDEETLRRKVRELEEAFSQFHGAIRIAYSMKANFNPAIVNVFASEGILFDVTSLGELYFYDKSGGSPENAIYTSVTEEEEEFFQVLQSGVSRIVVGSYNGLTNLISACRRAEITPKILVRVNPEVAVKAGIRASYKHSKFGVPFNSDTTDSAHSLVAKVMDSNGLIFEGFHFHLGSQVVDPQGFLAALDKLEIFIHRMSREYPSINAKVIDIGGGTPVEYGEPVPTPAEIAGILIPRLNQLAQRLSSNFTVILESGRYLCAESCVLISKIVNSKTYTDQKLIFVDAGYHLLLDAALVRQEYPQDVIPKGIYSPDSRLTVAGRLCDTYDIFPVSPLSNLGGASIGKLLVFRNVGAYSIVFNMPFHCQTKPAIVMRRMNGDFVVVREPQTIEELYKEEGGELGITF